MAKCNALGAVSQNDRKLAGRSDGWSASLHVQLNSDAGIQLGGGGNWSCKARSWIRLPRARSKNGVPVSHNRHGRGDEGVDISKNTITDGGEPRRWCWALVGVVEEVAELVGTRELGDNDGLLDAEVEVCLQCEEHNEDWIILDGGEDHGWVGGRAKEQSDEEKPVLVCEVGVYLFADG